MDYWWTREWNLTRLKERKKHINWTVSLQQGKIDWGKKRKKWPRRISRKEKWSMWWIYVRVFEKMLENSQRWQWWSEKGLQSDGLLSACGYWGTTETINRREGKSPRKNQQNAKISAMMMMFSGGKDDNDDRHHQWVAKSRAIDLEGGKGVRNDKVVTSNLAFARGHISLILLRPTAAAGITFFVRLMKNGRE